MNWTFGIPTCGDNDARLLPILDGIRSQIPKGKCEFIICGNSAIKAKDCKIIPFKEKRGKIWLTRKKNLICQAARFENICLFHDYFNFAPNWYQSFCKFGKNWDVAICHVKNKGGGKLFCWLTENGKYLDFKDKSRTKIDMYCSGGFYCVKKKFALQHPLDESLMWAEKEDVEWSKRIRPFWDYRINPNTFVQSLKQK